ncbi:hypothetical protein MP228_012594 [Amoeboaphelidium protococcarum]|nr:hypothetical protein MP228_012594 [Amoeboaphelidium protococcarum]
MRNFIVVAILLSDYSVSALLGDILPDCILFCPPPPPPPASSSSRSSRSSSSSTSTTSAISSQSSSTSTSTSATSSSSVQSTSSSMVTSASLTLTTSSSGLSATSTLVSSVLGAPASQVSSNVSTIGPQSDSTLFASSLTSALPLDASTQTISLAVGSTSSFIDPNNQQSQTSLSSSSTINVIVFQSLISTQQVSVASVQQGSILSSQHGSSSVVVDQQTSVCVSPGCTSSSSSVYNSNVFGNFNSQLGIPLSSQSTAFTAATSTGNVSPNTLPANESSIFGLPLYAGAAAVLVFVVTVAGLAVKYRRHRRAQRILRKQSLIENGGLHFSALLNPTSFDMPFNSSSATNMAGGTTMRTAVGDQREMSIPGYLIMQLNQDYAIEQQLGEGGFATVYTGRLLNQEAMQRAGSDTVAVKVLKSSASFDQSASDEDNQQAFIQEVSLLNFFSNNRLFVKLVGYSQNPNTIVMKYYPYGNLEDILIGRSTYAMWSIDLMIPLFCDIVEALSEMHKNGFVHSDIKPANILLNQDAGDQRFYAVISDFGVTQIVSNKAMLVQAFHVSKLEGASLKYAAPELLHKLQGELNADEPGELKLSWDVYALAILGYEMITCSPAWRGYAPNQIVDQVLRGVRPEVPAELYNTIAVDTRLSLILSLIQRAWAQQAQDRITTLEMREQLQSFQQ